MSKPPISRRQPRQPSRPHWTIDRKVPIANIVLLLFQTAAIVWWAATTDARITALEKDSTAQKLVISPQSERLSRLEVGFDYIKESLAEIKQLLRKTP